MERGHRGTGGLVVLTTLGVVVATLVFTAVLLLVIGGYAGNEWFRGFGSAPMTGPPGTPP